MRLLQVVMAPRYSGAEILARDLALGLTERGHEVALAALAPPESEFAPELTSLTRADVRLYMPNAPMTKLQRLARLRGWQSEFGPDVLVAHSVIPGAYARMTNFASRSPQIIIVLHAAGSANYREPQLRALEAVLAYRANAVVAVSNDGCEAYRRQFKRRAQHIPNGVPVSRIRNAGNARSTHRIGFGLAPSDVGVIQVGRIDPVKRQLNTVTSLAPLLRARTNTRLFLAGPLERPSYLSQIRTEINKQGIDDSVSYLGTRTDVYELLGALDVFVMPSEREAQSIALLEALASGIAIVASNISAFRFAEQFPGVWLVDPNNHAEYKAAVKSALLEGRRYERNMSEFEVTHTVSQYEALIASLQPALAQGWSR